MAVYEYDAGNVESSETTTSSTTATQITETERGLLPNTRYAMRVRAINNLGIVSGWSDAIEFITANDDTTPSAPTNVVLSTTDGHLTILWDEVTTNTDGTPIGDLAYYEITLQDNILYGGELLDPFKYTSITNSYTFLYSANNAIHDVVGESPSDDWTVSVRAVDYSGNTSLGSGDTIALSFTGTGSDIPVNFESTDYDGTDVETRDATDGIRIQENGEAEFNDLYVNGDLEVSGHSFLAPPMLVYSRNEANAATVPPRQNFTHDNWDAIVWLTSSQINNGIDGSAIATLAGGATFTIAHTAWYRLTLSHRWTINGTGARYAVADINGTYKGLGGHVGGASFTASEINNFTDSRIFYLSAGDTVVFRAKQDSGITLQLLYAQAQIEWVSD